MVLRRCRADDADFYKSCFRDPEFSTQYNRQQPWTGDLAKALTKVGTLSPADSRALHWIVTDKSTHPIGLATLTSLNVANGKAEFSIGFPSLGTNPPATAISPGAMATLLAFHFAFFVARLNKLTAYVYRGNDKALRNAQHIGFHVEGLLKDHFFLPPGEFVDVHALGLTRAQLQANRAILRVARRRLGLDWTPATG